MKSAALACALVLVVGAAGSGAQAGPEMPAAASPTTISGLSPNHAWIPGTAAPTGSEGGGGITEMAGGGELPPPQEVPRSGSPQRSSRNRYPGPIPTPEEWEPPEGPVRVGLQAGHWRADEAPRELSGIRDNGTSWNGRPEWEANLAIARQAGAMLQELGYEVDILPAVVPPSYRAHLFISIHADGSNDSRATGYRVAGPRRDATGRASDFVALLEKSYGEVTGLRQLPTVTHRMQNYYTFNYRRYENALHPMTIGVIIETGFLTSPGDRKVIVDDPGRAARGIVEAVKAFPVTPPPSSGGTG